MLMSANMTAPDFKINETFHKRPVNIYTFLCIVCLKRHILRKIHHNLWINIVYFIFISLKIKKKNEPQKNRQTIFNVKILYFFF